MADTKVAKAGVDVPLYINGIEKLSGKTFDVISPVTGKVIHKAAAVNVEEAGQAVAAAAEAFKSWQKAAPTQRRDIFLKAADIVQKRSAELIQYMVEETGSADPWAQFNVMLCAETLKDCAGRIATLEGSVPTIADPNRSAIVVQEPYGVVLSVVPWYVNCLPILTAATHRNTDMSPGTRPISLRCEPSLHPLQLVTRLSSRPPSDHRV